MIETKTNIVREVAALKQMTVKELRGRYLEVFGEPTRTGNKGFLFKRIIWRMQALAEGDLSERARRRAAELARDADLRTTIPRAPAVSAGAEHRTVTATVPHPGDGRLPPPDLVRRRIRQSLAGAKAWVLIGGPPCQAYSIAGRSRNRGVRGCRQGDWVSRRASSIGCPQHGGGAV